MPLSAPADRTPLHRREIIIQGYERADGLFDIEASLADTKTYAFDNLDRGVIRPGDKLHGMLARLTVNTAMLIVSAEAATDFGPFAICGGGAESFATLAGLTIGPGFIKQAIGRMAGTTGCTHLRELIQQMATTAFQTLGIVRRRQASAQDPTVRPRLLDSCFGYASDGEAVRRRWPAFYTGANASAEAASAGS